MSIGYLNTGDHDKTQFVPYVEIYGVNYSIKLFIDVMGYLSLFLAVLISKQRANLGHFEIFSTFFLIKEGVGKRLCTF